MYPTPEMSQEDIQREIELIIDHTEPIYRAAVANQPAVKVADMALEQMAKNKGFAQYQWSNSQVLVAIEAARLTITKIQRELKEQV